MFVVRVTSPEIEASEIQENMDSIVSGKIYALSDGLKDLTDWKTIKKVWIPYGAYVPSADYLIQVS